MSTLSKCPLLEFLRYAINKRPLFTKRKEPPLEFLRELIKKGSLLNKSGVCIIYLIANPPMLM